MTAAATRRTAIVGIVTATLILLGVVIADLATGGRPDPPSLRAEATLLDGPWRFKAGDDPRWAAGGTDDRAWETLDLTAPPGSHDGDVGLPDYVGGWMAQGHPDLRGYAWYRRAVSVPADAGSWDLLGPSLVEDGYELYWNGRLLGGSGRLGGTPRVVGTRPLRFALPADAAGSRGVLAVRVYMLPGPGRGADGGGMHSAPILAPRPAGEALHRAHWARTIAGYLVDVIEPIAMLAVIGLALWCRPRSSRKSFLVLAGVALLFMAVRRLDNAIASWTDLMDLRTYAWLASVMWVPAVAAWTLAWNRWCLPPWRSIDVGAAVLAVAGLAGAVSHSAAVTSTSRLGSIALFLVIGVRIVRVGALRMPALATLGAIGAALFGGELLDPIGVPGIWFPFNIGVSRTQFVYAIAVPVLAFLMVGTLPSNAEG